MQKEVDIKELQELGLSERESKIYLALLNSGPVLPVQILSMVSVPQSKIYEALKRLVQLGLVAEKPVDRKKLYIAVRPDDAIEHLIAQREQELAAYRQRGMQVKQDLMEMFDPTRVTPSAQDYFTFLKNQAQIRRLIEKLDSEAKTEICAFVKGPYEDSIETFADETEYEALKRGVRNRIMYEEVDANNEVFLKNMILPAVKAGEEARIHPNLPTKLMLFDSKVSLIIFMDEALPQQRTTIKIENKGIATFLKTCFESYWENSVTLDEFLRARSGGTAKFSKGQQVLTGREADELPTRLGKK